MQFKYNDGGRSAAGWKGDAGDCVVRAIAIATEKSYQEIYDTLYKLKTHYRLERNTRKANAMSQSDTSPRDGSPKDVYDPYLKSLGWSWMPTMKIGSGCKVHLRSDELPRGTLIVRVSKHLVVVMDGVIHDTHDCSRDGTRCVYGYYQKVESVP